MTELDAYNKLLGTLGEAPLQDADDEHPLLPAAKRQLAATKRIELGRGWWFNREVVTLHPDAESSFVYLPNDALSVDPTNTLSALVQRGRRLYDTSSATYVITGAVTVRLRRDLPFEDLPPNAQELVAAAAAVRFNLDYEGDQIKLNEARAEERFARIELGREDIRWDNINLLRRPSTAAVLNRIAGTNNRTRTA